MSIALVIGLTILSFTLGFSVRPLAVKEFNAAEVKLTSIKLVVENKLVKEEEKIAKILEVLKG